jgi:mitogen-activated protein kinase 1/3/mitogen-activated protein kinase 6
MHDFDHIYVVSDVMSTDMATLLKSGQRFLQQHVEFFIYQILRGMKYVHSAGVIHRDLRPRHLFVNQQCELKIGGFDSAQLDFEDWPRFPIESVGTSWYRAPESLGTGTSYSSTVDIWSIGCIFVEMLTGQPLFSAESIKLQLASVVRILGMPSGKSLKGVLSNRVHAVVRECSKTCKRELPMVLSGCSSAAFDLCERILCWVPNQRMTATEALQHPYLENLHCKEDEPVREQLLVDDFEFDRRHLTLEALREEVFNEILKYHSDLARKIKERRQRKQVQQEPKTPTSVKEFARFGRRLH